MGERGYKSAEELNGRVFTDPQPGKATAPRAPTSLNDSGKKLWREILASRPPHFYGPGDLPLLEQYCTLTKLFIPEIREKAAENFDLKEIEALNKLITRAESLAKDLRVCVSSRTRPDRKTSGGGDLTKPKEPWED